MKEKTEFNKDVDNFLSHTGDVLYRLFIVHDQMESTVLSGIDAIEKASNQLEELKQ